MAGQRLSRGTGVPRLSARGWTLLASGALLLFDALFSGRRDLLFLGALVLALPLLALAYVHLWRLRYSVVRHFTPPLVPAGSAATVRLLVRNRGLRPGSGASWRDVAPTDIEPPPRQDLATLSLAGQRGDRVTLEYVARPRHRGIVPIGPLLLRRQDPFGLAHEEYPVGPVKELIVTPRVTELPGHGLSIASGEGAVHEQLRHTTPNADELIAREYRPGDSMRRVHWPATARRGEIMVRQEEQRSNPEARLILDTAIDWRRGSGGEGSERQSRHAAAFETAVEFAASIGVHLIDAGFSLDVIETAAPQLGGARGGAGGGAGSSGLSAEHAASFRSPGGDRELLEGLAGLDQLDPESWRGASIPASTSALWRDGRRVPLFAILVDPDKAMCADLAALRAHGAPAIAVVQDTLSIPARESLEDAGWRLVELRGPRHIEDCWLEIRSGAGARRG